MSNKPVLFLIVLVAVAAVFWFLGGYELLGPDPSGDGDGASGERAGLLDGEADGMTQADEALGGSRGPSLFGRKREDLVGVGGLLGVVKDFKTGAGIEGATLVLLGTGYGDEKVSAQVLTGKDGHFVLARLAAGDRYQLHVNGPGKHQRSYPSVSVDAGSERDLGTIWLGQSGVLEGRVVDEADRPVAHADVQVFASGGSMMEIMRNFTKLFGELHKDAKPLQRTKTDSQGRFRIEQLDPGPISILVLAAAHHQKLQGEVMTSEGAAGGIIQVRLQRCEALAGVVVDEFQRGVSGARVACLKKNDMDSVLFGRQFTYTDDDGHFVIQSPPPGGDFAMIVTAEGYPMLLMESKSPTEELRLVLEGGAELLLRLLEKDTNRPVEGAHLMGMFNAGERFGSGDINIANAVTDHRGEATLLVRPGKLQMLFLNHPEKGTGMFSPMMGAMGASGILTGPEDTEVKKPRTTMVFYVQAGITIRGQVADEDENPILGARVMAMGAMGVGGNTTSGEGGLYELKGQSSPITAVLVTAPGYVQKFEGFGGVVGEKGQDVEHNLVMQRAATISGRVVDSMGTPLSGVRVKLSQQGPYAMVGMLTGTATEGITNKDGRYLLSGVSPGEKSAVIGRLTGWLDSTSKQFEIKPGQPIEAPDLLMGKGTSLEVTVRDPEGGLVRGARVQVSVQAEKTVTWDAMGALNGFADLLTRATGTVEVEDLPDGKVTITASKEGFASNRILVVIKEGKPVGEAAVVALREAYTLRGRVVDGEGQPASGVDIECNPISYTRSLEPGQAWAPNADATTDDEGRFEIKQMPDLPIKLRLSGDSYRAADQSLPGPRGEAEIRIRRMDAGTAARLEALQKELMRTYQQYAAAKTEQEKKAVLARMQKLQAEKAALEAGQSPEASKSPEDGKEASESLPSSAEGE